ncbi:MAG: hypothetical protein ABIH83_03015 [Candidatus Micrarchaeota archaeon]
MTRKAGNGRIKNDADLDTCCAEIKNKIDGFSSLVKKIENRDLRDGYEHEIHILEGCLKWVNKEIAANEHFEGNFLVWETELKFIGGNTDKMTKTVEFIVGDNVNTLLVEDKMDR